MLDTAATQRLFAVLDQLGVIIVTHERRIQELEAAAGLGFRRWPSQEHLTVDERRALHLTVLDEANAKQTEPVTSR